MPVKTLRIYTDGGARGNPGPAGSGAVVKAVNEDGTEGENLALLQKYLGETTNNQAEYEAIVIGLQKALELGAERVELVMDSELAVKQIKGEYRVKNPGLAVKYLRVFNLLRQFKSYSVRHVLRAYNKEADALVNQAIDNHLKRGGP
ncbi:ribonuclease HI family protein [Candidatus Uhrbacteria bacterium]|nr:ribonuclease HI family protein [Candidatus Uhrbacteria bacterium]